MQLHFLKSNFKESLNSQHAPEVDPGYVMIDLGADAGGRGRLFSKKMSTGKSVFKKCRRSEKVPPAKTLLKKNADFPQKNTLTFNADFPKNADFSKNADFPFLFRLSPKKRMPPSKHFSLLRPSKKFSVAGGPSKTSFHSQFFGHFGS